MAWQATVVYPETRSHFSDAEARWPDHWQSACRRDAELTTWLKRLREQDWRDAFVFFKHEDEGKGPQMAKRFLELAA